MNILVRKATAADFNDVGRVFAEENRFHSELVPEVIQVADPIMTDEWYNAVLAGPDTVLFVAEVDGVVAGVLMLREMKNPDDTIFCPRKYVYVQDVAVAQAFQRKGIGRKLMIKADEWAAERGIGEVELNVWETNERAIAFYKELGYETIRRRMKRLVDVESRST